MKELPRPSWPLTVDEARAIDLNAEYLGVPRELLMENAGRAVAEAVARRIKVEGKNVVVLAGTGNKGGDGFVASRHLAIKGAKVTVILLGTEDDIVTKEAKMNWRALKAMDLSVEIKRIRDSAELREVERFIVEADVVIDALIGTGLRGELREPFKTAVQLMNRSRGLKVAIDVPTGLNPDTGEVLGGAFRADVTVTMHRAKKGMAGREDYTGEVEVADIGIPPEAELYAGPGDVSMVIKPRRPDTHKYDYGVVVVIGGSPLYAGAPALAAMAALKAGCGLAVVVAPRSAAPYIKSYSPDLIVLPLKSDWLSREALEGEGELERLFSRKCVVVLGPGMGLSDESRRGFEYVLDKAAELGLRVVIDADGLKALKGLEGRLKNLDSALTPHRGEFKALFGYEPPLSLSGAVEAALREASRLRCTLVLKGHLTVVADGLRVKINREGNPGMAVGGVGDVLSGLIAGFMAQGARTFEACVAATFINGRAGNLTASEKGYHFTASDVLDKVPAALREYEYWLS